MITIRQAAHLVDRVEHIAARLSDTERDQLAKAALTLGEVRSLTLDRDYWTKGLQVVAEFAPSLAQELVHLTNTVEEIHRRLPDLRPRKADPT